MKYIPRVVLALFVMLGACRNEPVPADENTGAMQGAAPAAPAEQAHAAQMQDGVQVVHVEAGQMGYEPRRIELQAGVPARLVFKRTVESECLAQVQIPEIGVETTDLPLDEEVAVEFTPEEAGEYTFVCGMDMVRGTLVVRT